MKKRLALMIIPIAYFSFFAYSAPVSAQYTKETHLYAIHDGIALEGDLYLPKSGAPHPAIMLMHGGAWQLGSKEFYADPWDWPPYLAERGYAVFVINYRLSQPKAEPALTNWPECLLDAKAALQYLRGNSVKWGIDPDRIAVGGDSAGGQLGSMLALTQDWPAYANRYPEDPFKNVSTKVQAVVSAYGVFSMANWWMWTKNPKFDWAPFGMTTFAEELFGGTPQELPFAYFEASAINYVRAADKLLGEVSLPNAGTGVSWFITWGVDDPDVPAEGQSVPFVEALKQAGANVTAVPIPSVGHYWFNLGKITGQEGSPNDCRFDYETLEFTCTGPTPNDYIAPKLLKFLEENL